MSLIYGDLNTADLPWLAAKLQQWPTYPVSTTVYNYPRGDGGYFRAPRMIPTEWKFNLEITASSWQQAQQYAEQLTAKLYAGRGGLQRFTPEGMTPWVWQALCTSGPSWKRDKVLWFGSQGVCRMTGETTFQTPDPYGYAPVENTTITDVTGAAVDYAVTGFTLPFYPEIRLTGPWNDGSVLQLNSTVLSTKGIPDGSTIVLDYATQDYYYQNAVGTRLGSVVSRLKSFSRIQSNDVGVVRLRFSIQSGRGPTLALVSCRRRRL